MYGTMPAQTVLLTEADEPLKRFWWIRRAMCWSLCKGLRVPVKWHKSLAGVCKAQMHLMLGLKGYFLFVQSCRCHCCFVCYDHGEVLIWFVQMLFG